MSEPSNIQQIIQDQIDILPESVREAVDSQEWRRKVYDIGRRYSLKIDQLGALEQSTYYTMIGLIPSSQYISELVNQVGVGRDVASSLAQEIDDKVFEDIRSFIMQMDGVDEDIEGSISSTSSTTSIPSGAIPSREDLLSEIEAIGEPSSSPAPVVSFSPIETQLSTATASRPVELNPQPAPAPAPALSPAPVLAQTPEPVVQQTPVIQPAPVSMNIPEKKALPEIPLITLGDASAEEGIEFSQPEHEEITPEITTPTLDTEAPASYEPKLDLDTETAQPTVETATSPSISNDPYHEQI